MKKLVLLTLLVGLFTGISFAQGAGADVKEGDVFTIAKVENNQYQHIHFPKNNFIIKKGGVADYNTIVGEQVEVTSVKEKKNGKVVATIKLSSDHKFFMSHKYVTVDLNEAISSNELSQN
ncbi:hypothetical protein [Carboxylicivirga marina]|uniref:Dihydroorotase n=1 Tax=Carboxylicivirga marina TaxID=2800988 RepID=A0ABS1HP97_9BACT|nr:hypothetical protein [Carboxylicivirga marina]MBK3519416.1 hypothetical protein [Carboxylicivirga marina]